MWLFVLQILFSTSYALLIVVVVPFRLFTLPTWLTEAPQLASLHVVLYIIVSVRSVSIFYHSLFQAAIIANIARTQHRASRARGYLKYYRQTAALRQIPYWSTSAGNAAILLLWGCTSLFSASLQPFILQYTLYAVSSAEMLLTVPVCVLYMVKLSEHNSLQPPSDASELLAGSLVESTSAFPTTLAPIAKSYGSNGGSASTVAAEQVFFGLGWCVSIVGIVLLWCTLFCCCRCEPLLLLAGRHDLFPGTESVRSQCSVA